MAEDKTKDSSGSGTGAKQVKKEGENLPESLLVKAQSVKKRRFELEVFDENLKDDGSVEWKPVKFEKAIIVEAATPEELKVILNQYRLCGQLAKVVRALDPPLLGDQQPAPIAATQLEQAAPPRAFASQGSSPQSPVAVPALAPMAAAAPKPKAKIITIGDMQVKYDGDKVYQKQWVKLNANEASNFRVVSDASNKIVPMTGKHIEARRWVRVEESSEDNVDDAVESILAGN